jgi:hypothetical protein
VRGWACGLLSNFAEYPGSDWLLFGISSLDFYLTPGYGKTLEAALERMRGDAAARVAQPPRNGSSLPASACAPPRPPGSSAAPLTANTCSHPTASACSSSA